MTQKVPSGPLPLKFDISKANEANNRWRRIIRWSAWGLLIGWDSFTALLFVSHGKQITSGTLQTSDWVLLGATLAVAGLFSWISFNVILGAGTSGARLITIDSDGIALDYASGRTLRLRWESPNFAMELADFSVRESLLSRTILDTVEIRGNTTNLPREVFVALLSQLESRGLIASKSRPRQLLVSDAIQPMVYLAKSPHARR